jgi:type I restriction enzyme S subunit
VSQIRTLKIEDFCRTGSGSTPSRNEIGRYYENGTIPWVKSGELREGLITSTDECVTEAALRETSIKLVPKGAILLAMYGATVGRLALLGIEATTNQAVCHIIPDANMADTRYLYHALASQVPSIIAMGVGGAQPNISQALVKGLKIPLHPLPEQRRIAAILDKADALRTKRREVLAHLDRLAQSIFVEMFGDPVTNPKGWRTLPLTEACQCYSGGTPSKTNAEYWNGNLPWFSPKDLKRDDLHNSEDHINSDVPNRTSLRLLSADTVAIVVRGMILAHTFPVSVLRVPATINQDLKALLPNVPLRPQFLANCLRVQSSSILERVSEAGHGTKRLDSEGLRGINILLPNISSQDEFEDRVRVLKELQASSTKSYARLNSLFISLQHGAFRGEL